MILDIGKEQTVYPIKREVTVIPVRKTVTETQVQTDYKTRMVRELQLDEGLKDLDLKERLGRIL